MLEIISNHDLLAYAQLLGYVGLTLIIFVETGLFVGFFLPGDSLLFAAGILASKQIFNIWILLPLFITAAIAGYLIAYWFGKKLGNWLMKRKDSFWFKKHYLTDAQIFYGKHGGKALILGRLLPIVRTFVPIVAGMANMNYAKYNYYNMGGGLLWAGGVTLAGYYIGSIIPNAERYIIFAVLIVIFLSFLPMIYHFLQSKVCRRCKHRNFTT